ncbi:hypothetical protein [Nonomuraea sp. KM90]|uniref:hypothetical protein n=1 Tax=Nonomuraea sp. KM90 TaxID=3457428 RepID=UPI003FCCBB8D
MLWRLLYETAARAEKILTLNIEDLDPEFRRARVTSKGGAIEYVHWATPTARLLPRLLAGRTSGPVFLADRRAPTCGPRVPADGDIDPTTRRGRLSYPRAEYLFKTASATLDPHGKAGPCTSCGTRRSSTSPRPGAARPNRKPRAATSTWPASATTCDSVKGPPPASPWKQTRPAPPSPLTPPPPGRPPGHEPYRTSST